MGLIKKIFLGAIACIVVVTAIGMLNPSPQEVVKEAFAKHEIDSLSKKYNSADEKVKADYHQLYRQAMLKGFEECVNFDRENKFNYDGEKRWQNLNKMAQFALNINDKSFESDKKLAKNINECTKLRKEYSDGCLELYKKYKVSETSQISVIRRYIVNELTNAKGVYYACGYEEIFGNYIPKDDFNECVLDFSNANFTSLRRGVNRLNVVYDGKEKLEMQGGFKTEVDRFKVVPSEAMYIQEDLRIMKNNIEAQFNRGMMNLKTMTAEQNRANALKK